MLLVDGTSDRSGGTQDFLDGTLEGLGHGLAPHDASNLDDIVEGHVAVMEVGGTLGLLLLGSFLQSLDNQSRGGGLEGDGSLTVLDLKLHGDTKTLPVLGGLGDIITNLLGGKTEGTDLGGKRRGSSGHTSDNTEVQNLNFIGVELGRHFAWCG